MQTVIFILILAFSTMFFAGDGQTRNEKSEQINKENILRILEKTNHSVTKISDGTLPVSTEPTKKLFGIQYINLLKFRWQRITNYYANRDDLRTMQ